MNELPFLNRVNELKIVQETIEETTSERSARILCIQGAPGVGKTRLLKEIGNRYPSNQYPYLMLPSLIDFDEIELQDPLQLRDRIATLLGHDFFTPYIEATRAYLMLKEQQAIQSIKQEFENKLAEEFVKSFNLVSAQKIVVLRFDTTDALERTTLWSLLGQYAYHLKNTVMIFAGRNAFSVADDIESTFLNQVRRIPLFKIADSDAIDYVKAKEEQLHITLIPEMREKIVWLFEGYPVMLDLAVEWMVREPLPEWLRTEKLTALQHLPNDQLEEQRNKLKEQIVLQFGSYREMRDRLIINLAHVHPIEEEAVPILMNIPSDKADNLVKELRDLGFVKSLPSGRIKLHDYAQELVLKYVLPQEEKRGSSTTSLCERYVAYLDSRIQAVRAELIKPGVDRDPTKQVYRRQLQTALYNYLESQRLNHVFHLNPLVAAEKFRTILKETDDVYNVAYRESITKALDHFPWQRQPDLTEEMQFEVNYERCDTYVRIGEFEVALEFIHKYLFRLAATDPQKKIRTLLLAGNAYIRHGEVERGKANFEQAVQISHDGDFLTFIVQSEEALGWSCRLMSNWNQAREHYVQALIMNAKLSKPDLKHEASLLTNLAFVQSYLHRDAAAAVCSQAIEKWQGLGDRHGLGRGFSTQGCLYYHAGQYDKALGSFRKALEIFEMANDFEWMSVVLSWRGATYLAIGIQEQAEANLDLASTNLMFAEDDLRNALKMGPRRDAAMTLNRLARVVLIRDRTDEALELLKQSYSLSLETSNALYEIASLRDLTKIAVSREEFAKFDEFDQKLTSFLSRWGRIEDFTLGGMYLYLGVLALGIPGFGLELPIARFQAGLELISTVRNYAAQDLDYYIKDLDRMLKTVAPPPTIREIGRRLMDFWAGREELRVSHPEAIVSFTNWITFVGKRNGAID